MYIIGVIIALIISVGVLTFTKDENCNVTNLRCLTGAILISFGSWLTILVFIALEARGYYLRQ